MAKKKPDNDYILFSGKSSEDVTGSQYYIKFNNKKILLECGLYQSKSNNYLDSYKVNNQNFQFNASELDYVFLCHCHIDHIGLVPKLIKEGFNGKIIATAETIAFAKALLLNSQYLLNEQSVILSRKYKRDYSPIYAERDVYKSFDYMYEYNEYNKIYELDDNISFQWFKNSHCIGATQLQIMLNNGNKRKKILYTSDIGSLNPNNHYVEKTEIPGTYSDITIMESTYGDKSKKNTKTRESDIKVLKKVINNIIEKKGTIIFPAFSFSRSQEILTVLYNMFSDSNLNYNIVVDSKLTCDICDLYNDTLANNYLKQWSKIYNWDKIKFIYEKSDSKMCLSDSSPKIVISSSGFCTNGRILNYLAKYLRDANSMIVFTGYVGDNDSYLSYRIKNNEDYKSININKSKINNNAKCISLNTFSSHANRKDLITYGSNILTEKIILVHGSEKSKLDLKNDLQDVIFKNNKTHKVLCSNKNMVINL